MAGNGRLSNDLDNLEKCGLSFHQQRHDTFQKQTGTLVKFHSENVLGSNFPDPNTNIRVNSYSKERKICGRFGKDATSKYQHPHFTECQGTMEKGQVKNFDIREQLQPGSQHKQYLMPADPHASKKNKNPAIVSQHKAQLYDPRHGSYFQESTKSLQFVRPNIDSEISEEKSQGSNTKPINFAVINETQRKPPSKVRFNTSGDISENILLANTSISPVYSPELCYETYKSCPDNFDRSSDTGQVNVNNSGNQHRNRRQYAGDVNVNHSGNHHRNRQQYAERVNVNDSGSQHRNRRQYTGHVNVNDSLNQHRNRRPYAGHVNVNDSVNLHRNTRQYSFARPLVDNLNVSNVREKNDEISDDSGENEEGEEVETEAKKAEGGTESPEDQTESAEGVTESTDELSDVSGEDAEGEESETEAKKAEGGTESPEDQTESAEGVTESTETEEDVGTAEEETEISSAGSSSATEAESATSPGDTSPDKSTEDNGSSGGSTTSSSGGSTTSSGKEKKAKKKKKRRGFWGRLLISGPDEQRLLKMVLWFPIGGGISLLLYYMIIEKMNIKPLTKGLIGAGLGLVLSLTFSLSIQMRCIMCLVVPTFVGKAGRSYIAAFALIYLINGPITNIIENSKEVVRSLSCQSALLANHSKEKWKLRLHPVDSALSDILGDTFKLNRVSKRVEKAFKPLRKEVEGNMKESKLLKKHIKKVESETGNREKTEEQKLQEARETEEDRKKAGKTVEKAWEKKLNLRCEDTFAHGVERCKQMMGKLEDKCMSALSILGYLFCWPLKITLFCQIVKVLPGVFGMKCDSAKMVDPGFGQTFVDARTVVDDMDEGMKVQMQYKVVGTADIDYTPVEEMRQATIQEVNKKATIVSFFFSFIAHILTFTFLIIFHGAYTYNKKYLDDLGFDNNYLTWYYRHIDARRKDQNKKTLLPLKKAEKKDYVDPAKIVLTKGEKGKLTKGTASLILRVVISAIICYMDSLFCQVLDIISRNSRVEYHQTGEHVIDIKVYGNGFMSALVRGFLEKFNSKKTLDKVTTNHACLPRPSQTDDVIVGFIFGTYCVVWIFMYFEAFGLRMRRLIAAFFYRKREKKRVLYLYNEMFRKRLGFLRHMRKKVRKQLRERELQKKVGLIMALQRHFPRMCKCLSICHSKKDSCIICNEPEGEGFYSCPTEGCGVGYCRGCWVDIKRKCYACGMEGDESDDDSPDSDDQTDDDSD